MQVNFTLRGSTDLLMHRDNIEFADEMEKWRADPDHKDISKKGDDRSPAWSWLGCLYHDGKNLVMPSDNLLTCLRQAGATMQIPGKKGKTYKEATQSAMIMHDENLAFMVNHKQIPVAPLLKLMDAGDSRECFSINQKTAAEFGFTLFVKRAKIGQNKHVRVRPRFSAWSVSGVITVEDTELLPPHVLDSLFESAGRKGLGDWRPGGKTPGTFGQFATTLTTGK